MSCFELLKEMLDLAKNPNCIELVTCVCVIALVVASWIPPIRLGLMIVECICTFLFFSYHRFSWMIRFSCVIFSLHSSSAISNWLFYFHFKDFSLCQSLRSVDYNLVESNIYLMDALRLLGIVRWTLAL